MDPKDPGGREGREGECAQYSTAVKHGIADSGVDCPCTSKAVGNCKGPENTFFCRAVSDANNAL